MKDREAADEAEELECGLCNDVVGRWQAEEDALELESVLVVVNDMDGPEIQKVWLTERLRASKRAKRYPAFARPTGDYHYAGDTDKYGGGADSGIETVVLIVNCSNCSVNDLNSLTRAEVAIRPPA